MAKRLIQGPASPVWVVGADGIPGEITVNQGAAGTDPWLVEVSDEPVEVVGIGTTITVTPTLTVAGAYAAGDFVGTSATAMTFANAARVSGGSGVIETAILVDGDLQSIAAELWLFDTAPTPPNDNAAWTISDANALTCIGVIPFSSYYASALNSVSVARGLGIAFSAVGGTSIYGCLVTRGAPTYVSGNLSVRLAIMQD